jgi:hypothetical protein
MKPGSYRTTFGDIFEVTVFDGIKAIASTSPAVLAKI